jgi:hypothetical protein
MHHKLGKTPSMAASIDINGIIGGQLDRMRVYEVRSDPTHGLHLVLLTYTCM